MKKGTSFFYISLAFLAVSIFSCKLKMEDEDLYDKPGVNITQNQVTVIIPKVGNGTKYINVYRRDKQNDEAINIGILYHPQALENDGKNYCYIDSLITKSHSYEYRVRYYIDGEYYYSEWSDKIFIESTYNAYDESVNLAYRANGCYLEYEPTDYSLTFRGNIQTPSFTEYSSQNYKPMLIVQCGDKTQVFDVPAITDTTKVALRSILPSDFFDTDISIQGIVAQRTIFDDDSDDELLDNDTNSDGVPDTDKQKKVIIWTAPTSLELVGAGSAKLINIPSQTGTAGLDYGRRVK